MTKRKMRKMLKQSYGQKPEVHYFAGDMERTRSYYDFRRENRMDDFLVDDITWNDLDMDRLYRRINPGLTTSGEQYLYYMLRSPAVDKQSFDERDGLIFLFEREAELRLELQLILARLGRSRRADMCSAFYPRQRSPFMLMVYLLLALAIPALAIGIAFYGQQAVIALIAMISFNALLHSIVTRKIQMDLDTVNYSVGMIFAMSRVKKLGVKNLDRFMDSAYESLGRLRSVIRVGGVSSMSDSGGLGDMICSVLLLDLITYEFLKNKLGNCHDDVFAIHEHLGRLDAAIAIASYRESLQGNWCRPELEFNSHNIRLRGADMRHPLLDFAVPNSIDEQSSILITGSNASGKSTFLKTAALCALMGQSICTCCASAYCAPAFRIMSSMALRDDILAGESYYIVETRSLKRILDASSGLPPVLCVVDEVLRGTNTVERIAASSAVLETMAGAGCMCLAATHDIELCALLGDCYSLYHFREQVGGEKMEFDYLLRPGKATSRNAINLLRLMGFGENIVNSAHERANSYLEDGVWQ